MPSGCSVSETSAEGSPLNDADIQELIRLREEARANRDFARADELRDETAAAGYELRDTPGGPVVEKGATFERRHPASIESLLHEEASLTFSIHVLYEDYPEDLDRFLRGLRAHSDTSSTEVVIVDNASADGEHIEKLADDLVRVVHLDREVGWAAARNAGLKCARGEIVVLADLSIEPVGDILSPLSDALADPSVGLAGPFGLVSEKMREWESSDGPEVDALEGYLIATRRRLLAKGLFSEKFKWYRNADIDLSFQIRSDGLKAMVVPLPVRKHVHRGWEALDAAERAKRSKRNHYLFFDRWKGRHDLLLSHRS
jgi:cysteinyl-tRNA synthetase